MLIIGKQCRFQNSYAALIHGNLYCVCNPCSVYNLIHTFQVFEVYVDPDEPDSCQDNEGSALSEEDKVRYIIVSSNED